MKLKRPRALIKLAKRFFVSGCAEKNTFLDAMADGGGTVAALGEAAARPYRAVPQRERFSHIT